MWTPLSPYGTWQITNNAATPASYNGADAIMLTTITPQNYVLTSTATSSNTAALNQFYLRTTDVGNTVIVSFTNTNVTVFNIVSGSAATVSSASFARGTSTRLYTISINGTALVVKVDSATVLSTTLPNQTNAGSKVGVASASTSTPGVITWDDFKITNQ